MKKRVLKMVRVSMWLRRDVRRNAEKVGRSREEAICWMSSIGSEERDIFVCSWL